jgi:hypothetical protein
MPSCQAMAPVGTRRGDALPQRNMRAEARQADHIDRLRQEERVLMEDMGLPEFCQYAHR